MPAGLFFFFLCLSSFAYNTVILHAWIQLGDKDILKEGCISPPASSYGIKMRGNSKGKVWNIITFCDICRLIHLVKGVMLKRNSLINLELLLFIYLFSQDNRDAMIGNFDSAWGKNNQALSEAILYYQMLPVRDCFSQHLCPYEDEGASSDGMDKKYPRGVHLFEETT